MDSKASSLARENEEVKTLSAFERWSIFPRTLLADRYVASIAPSSTYASDLICSKIDFGSAQTIVELGAGNGAVTNALLDRMTPDSRLFGFELNKTLAENLEETISDSRFVTINDDAKILGKFCQRKKFQPDVIVSGIPFSILPEAAALDIMRAITFSLKPEGLLVMYQTWLPPFFTARHCRRMLSHCFVEQSVDRVYRNLPPLAVITFRRR